MATYRAGFVLASVLHILGFNAIVCVRLGAALQRQHGKRRQIRPFTNIPTDAAQLTKTPACSAEYLYFVPAVFVFKTFTFVLITLSAQHQLWHHGILSLGLPSNFSSTLASC